MPSIRELFFAHQGQTSPFPPALRFTEARGCYLTDEKGKRYLDLISGIGVSSLGHGQPAVVKAVQAQAEKHMHLMVYGEYIQDPQVRFCALLAEQLPKSLSSIFLVNSGAEAMEGAMKLAKRATGRPNFISFHKAYHGSTHGPLSLMGGDPYHRGYAPLLPGVRRATLNEEDVFALLDESVAAVVVEVFQGEAGVVEARPAWLKKLQKACKKSGSLLIFDEIQTGFGRTGKTFAFEHSGVVPDVLVMAKAMGAGMPLGGFAASPTLMATLSSNPILGHLTTFGGHPVSCAAAEAGLHLLLNENLAAQASEKEAWFRKGLMHPSIQEIRGKGLMLAVDVGSFERVQAVIKVCFEKGLLTDWFLFNDTSIRIAPPLVISKEEAQEAMSILREALDLTR